MLIKRESNIHGVGVFATEFIPKGTKIVEFTGTKMSQKDFKERYGNDLRYTYHCNFPWIPVIVSKECRNIITWINDGKHNQENVNVNVYLKKYWLYAAEDILPDTELLLDYGKRYWLHHATE